MGVKWTKEQQKVISLRDRNILVSAAAGSGKTAVLVERILSKITDKKRPVDIDRLLVMTFTRAAAGEMKERISAALTKALENDPDNEHLQRQTTLIHTAQITTIDGFCGYILKNYFHLIGLDPGYRIAEEGELKLIRGDVIKALMEDYYQKKDEKFHLFVECYASEKTDERLETYILKMYEAAMSSPYPLEWLEECLDSVNARTVEELGASKWMELLWETAEEELEHALWAVEEGLRICTETDGPYLYEDMFASDKAFLETLIEAAEDRDYDEMAGLLGNPSYMRLSTKKAEDVDPKMREMAKALRDEEKTILKELKERYFHSTLEEIFLSVQCERAPMEMLAELTREFIRRYGEAKRKKNILDFTDMEHFALDILMTKAEDGSIQMTQAARELSEKYDEVMVDEYQDSNLVQELLTNCVSGWASNRKNIFMVGDVKQSIYRFRLARPEIFMEKYKSYDTKDGEEQRIDLHKNFRSRAQVLDSVNFLFRQIMGEDLGGITYDKDAALYVGADFPENSNEEFPMTEVLLIEKDGELTSDLEEKNAVEMEALEIAHRIRDMVGTEKVLDKETGEYRPLEYGDIVILLRAAYGWADTIREVLAASGIPAYSASRTGYFSALEVVTVLNYLKISDNPLQDIPMAGVLRSPMVGCTAQELAVLRSTCPEGMLYESVCAYRENCPDQNDELYQKLSAFWDLLERVRDLAVYTPVHQLILYILKETGYGNYARAMPGGEQRAANLGMLVEKAMDYEKTSYRGLFNFVRYIEQLHKYEVDFGEVNLSAEGQGTVQIMTIHKSKGLEFPVVFVAGMGKRFNFRDVNDPLLIHPELGVGVDAIIPEKRIIASSVNRQVIRRKILKESLGEELRVLYVAMTRAKEKLILTGTASNIENLMLSLARYAETDTELIPFGERVGAMCYWDFVLPALARHPAMGPLFEEYGMPGSVRRGKAGADFIVRKIMAAELAGEEVVRQTEAAVREEMLKNWDSEKVWNKTVRKGLEERFSFVYPYSGLEDIPVKVSVSDLKKRSWHSESDLEESVLTDSALSEEEVIVPRFIAQKEEEYAGAARGTAYHRVMECLDYTQTETDEQLIAQLDLFLQQKKLNQAQRDCIRIRDLRRFLDSGLGQRMRSAGADGRLVREQPFVISRNASEIDVSWPESETVLIQGIMDAYFFEDGEVVLVDYKTDRVKRDGGELLLTERYHTQLEDYAQALERMTGKRVKEKYIYSFTLGKEILLPEK